MKKLLLTIPLCLVSLTALSQARLRTSDLIRLGGFDQPQGLPELVRRSAGEGISSERISMIVCYEDESALAEMELRGAEILNTLSDGCAIVSVRPADAVEVAAAPGVTEARLSQRLQLDNDNARAATGVNDVQNGVDLPRAYDGEGVICGIFDVGMDPNHINFRGEDGNSRVTMLWNYTSETGQPRLYDTASAIKTFSSDTGSQSHGAHTTGVMAGSFVDESDPEGRDYRGVATGAEIVMAAGAGYDSQILDAIKRIGEYAREQGKPCVLNLSFGSNLGPHDASDLLSRQINALAAEYDIALSMSVGNDRQQKISIVKTLTEENPSVSTFLTRGSYAYEGYFQSYSPIEVWTEDATPFDVVFEIIDKANPSEPVYTYPVSREREGYVIHGSNIAQYIGNAAYMDLVNEGTPFQEIYYQSFMGGLCQVDPTNRRFGGMLNAFLYSSSAENYGKYAVRLKVTGKPGQKIFIYCEGKFMNFDNFDMEGVDAPDGNGTNSTIACGTETITVGSFVSGNNSASGYPFCEPGSISFFSSYGDTPTGRSYPDVVAPGQVIVSSRNYYLADENVEPLYPICYQYRDQSDPKRKKWHYWTVVAGTSQAAPHVAGIMALLRSVNPDLKAKEIYDIIRKTADDPQSTEPGWGYGKVNALSAMKEVVKTTGVRKLAENGVDPILVEAVAGGYDIYVPGEESVTVEVYDIAGKLHGSIRSNEEKVTLSTASFNGGVYVVKVTTPAAQKSFKICR